MKPPGGMGDWSGLMKQAQKQLSDFQKKMKEMDEKLKDRIVEGSAGGGMVKVLFNGKQEVVDVKIDPTVLEEEDQEFLEEMVMAAIRQGLEKSNELAEQEKGKITGGMNIPGLENLM